MEFQEKVRALMKSRGLKQRPVAESLGVQQPVVSRWLTKNTPPEDRGRLLALARLLGTTVDYLIDDARTQADPSDELTPDERTVLQAWRYVRGKVDAGTVAAAIGEAGNQRTPLPSRADMKPGMMINGVVFRPDDPSPAPVTTPAKRSPRSKG